MNRSLILFMLLVFCCISCKKYEPDLMEGYTINASGLRNGKPWKGSAKIMRMSDNQLLNIGIIDKYDYQLSQFIQFIDIDTSLSQQHLRDFFSVHNRVPRVVCNMSNYDQTMAAYGILDDNDTNNSLQILSQESGFSQKIKFQFSVTFLLKNKASNLSDKELYPDTLRFENVVVNIDAVE